MAEKENHKIADQATIAEDDPFAELTRIVGFDPRQPVMPKAVGSPVANKPMMAEPVNASVDDIDFGIDLERELLGDLGLELDMTAGTPADHDRTAAAETVVAVEDEVAPVELTAADLIDMEADAAGETAPEAGEAGYADAIAAEADAPESWEDRGQSDEPGPDRDGSPAALAVDEIEHPVKLAATGTVDLPLAEAEMLPAEAYGDFDTSEKILLAEHDVEEVEPQLDSDEGAHADAPVVKAEEADDQWVQPDPPQEEGWSDEPDLQLDKAFDAAFADEPQTAAHAELDPVRQQTNDPSFGVEAIRREQADYVAPEAALEMSLEAELNALLGNTPETVASASVRPVQATNRLGIFPATMRGPAQDGQSEASRMQISDELDDDLDTEPVAPIGLAETQQQVHAESPVQFMDEVSVDDELDFDAGALEAALSNAVSSAFAETSGPEVSSEDEATQRRESESFMPRDGRDPYAALAALSADLKPSRSWSDDSARDPYFDRTSSTQVKPGSGRLEAPEIETVDVPEQAVALADDLDLPELALEDETVRAAHYDDIDAEFSTLLAGMNAGASQAEPARQARFDNNRPIHVEQSRNEAYYDDRVAPAFAATAAAGLAASRSDPFPGYDPAYTDSVRYAEAGAGMSQANAHDDAGLAYDPDFDEEIAGPPAYAPIAERPARRRGMLVAAVVGGVAVLGGVAAFALSFGDGPGAAEVALVKADSTPVKVKPENPGGTAVPNQDSKVYDSVGGAGAAAEPTQEKLLNSAEEPVPMPEDEPVDTVALDEESADDLPATDEAEAEATAQAPARKGEDRIEQLIEEPGVDTSVEVAAVAPRKVRTMIVKADGSLVAREEPVAAQPVDSASEGIVDPVASTAVKDSQTTATVPNSGGEEGQAVGQDASAAPKPQQAAAEPAAPQPATETASGATPGTTPKTVPVAPARPSDQPVDIVGEVKAQQVAALDPASAPAPGSWSMQIASQPTEAAAQASYKDLARRYGSVLDGRQAMIVKADIAGKGTFWRVRVPAGSRNEAVKLCESYKSAGGNCFVSK